MSISFASGAQNVQYSPKYAVDAKEHSGTLASTIKQMDSVSNNGCRYLQSLQLLDLSKDFVGLGDNLAVDAESKEGTQDHSNHYT